MLWVEIVGQEAVIEREFGGNVRGFSSEVTRGAGVWGHFLIYFLSL